MRSLGFASLPTAVLLIAALSAPPAAAQPPAAADPCAMPVVAPASREPSLFTPEQSVMLGNVLARSLPGDAQVIGDGSLAAYLQAIADRMIAIALAPPVVVRLIDIPEVNAAAAPGRRIYVARKVMAVAQNEDEVAGIVAHEIGHVIAGDSERNVSAAFRKILKVTSLGDERDVEDKYHQLLDAIAEGRTVESASTAASELEQENADRLAVWLMARAGYKPQAFATVWNRVQELDSKSGSWLTDLLRLTRPGGRRLRISQAAADAIAPACIGARVSSEREFAEWREAVLAATRTKASGTAATLRGVKSERKLEPPLRSSLSRLKFSPDGATVLAQDESGIYLFSRNELKLRYRLDALDARRAQFSPDSSAVVFYDPNYRVERWSVTTGAREWVRELVMAKPCLQSELSPDGAYLACVTAPDLHVRVYEVATGSVVFEKEFFITASALGGIVLAPSAGDDQEIDVLQLRFSPDARYLVVARNTATLCVDLPARRTISLPGAVRERVGLSFAFLADGRILGLHLTKPAESGIVTFPEGKVVSKVNMGRYPVAAPAHGDRYALLGQVPSFAVALFDLTTGTVKGGNRTPGFDMYDDHFVGELRSGEIALYKLDTPAPSALVTVPPGPLGSLRAVDVSADFAVLAASQTSRGAIWNLDSGTGLLTRPFRGASVDGRVAYLDFPREANLQRTIVKIDAATLSVEPLIGIEETAAGPDRPVPKQAPPIAGKPIVTNRETRDIVQRGPVLLATHIMPGTQPNTVKAFELSSAKQLWMRPPPKSWPAAIAADPPRRTVTFAWPYSDSEARSIVEANPGLAKKFEALKVKKDDAYVIEVLDLVTGAVQSRHVSRLAGGTILPAADLSVSGDRLNRTRVHSLSTGDVAGRVFGRFADIDAQSGRTIVLSNRREVAVYALPKLEKVDSFLFPDDVAFVRLAAGGQRLFVLTAAQIAYTLEIGAPAGSR